MSREKFQDFARELVRRPGNPERFRRVLEAAEKTRKGLAELEELALEEVEPSVRSVYDSSDLARFTLGDRLLGSDEEELSTDLGDFASLHLRLALGAGSVDDLKELLAGFTSESLEEEAVSALSSFLATLPAAALEELHAASTRSVPVPAEALPSKVIRANLGALTRMLQRAAKLPNLEACFEVLSGSERPFAERFAAGVILCRKTRELARDRPGEAARWATRAGRVADEIAADPRSFIGRMASFLALFASAHIGNALRISGHPIVAEQYFQPWEEDDLLGLRAEYLALKATLRWSQRRFSESLELLRISERIARRRDFPGAAELQAQTKIVIARTLTSLSEFSAAAEELRYALDVVEGEKLSGHLRLIILENLAECLTQSGNLSEAGSLLPEVERLGVEFGLSEADRLRIAWVRSRTMRPEEWTEAREELARVKNGFAELGLVHDAALASLELARWHAEELPREDEAGRELHLEAIGALASESARFFAGVDITPEAVAAIALFRHISLSGLPTSAALGKVERMLRKASAG